MRGAHYINYKHILTLPIVKSYDIAKCPKKYVVCLKLHTSIPRNPNISGYNNIKNTIINTSSTTNANKIINHIDIDTHPLKHNFDNDISAVKSTPEVTTTSSPLAVPPEVQSNSLSTRRGASSNYLSVNGRATPRDRGRSVVIVPQVEPESDLRELEGEVNKKATTASGKESRSREGGTPSGKESRIVTSNGEAVCKTKKIFLNQSYKVPLMDGIYDDIKGNVMNLNENRMIVWLNRMRIDEIIANLNRYIRPDKFDLKKVHVVMDILTDKLDNNYGNVLLVLKIHEKLLRDNILNDLNISLYNKCINVINNINPKHYPHLFIHIFLTLCKLWGQLSEMGLIYKISSIHSMNEYNISLEEIYKPLLRFIELSIYYSTSYNISMILEGLTYCNFISTGLLYYIRLIIFRCIT